MLSGSGAANRLRFEAEDIIYQGERDRRSELRGGSVVPHVLHTHVQGSKLHHMIPNRHFIEGFGSKPPIIATFLL